MPDKPSRGRFGIAALLVLVIAFYQWVVTGLLGPNRTVGTVVTLICVALCVEYNRSHSGNARNWGFDFRKLIPGLRLTILVTVPALALILFAGYVLGSLHGRDHPLQDLSVLFLWSLAQQFALQTVVYRSLQDCLSARPALLAAAAVFAALHLPNPLLTTLTFIGGLVWCWIYSRNANLLPLALSHSLCSFTVLCSFSRGLTGGMRVGYPYLML